MSDPDQRLLTHVGSGHSGLMGIPDVINAGIDRSDIQETTVSLVSNSYTSSINNAIGGTINLVSGNFALSPNLFGVYFVSSADGSSFDGTTDTFDLHFTSTSTMAAIGLVANESASYSFLGDFFTQTNSAPVPEPSSALILAIGALGFAARRRRSN